MKSLIEVWQKMLPSLSNEISDESLALGAKINLFWPLKLYSQKTLFQTILLLFLALASFKVNEP